MVPTGAGEPAPVVPEGLGCDGTGVAGSAEDGGSVGP